MKGHPEHRPKTVAAVLTYQKTLKPGTRMWRESRHMLMDAVLRERGML